MEKSAVALLIGLLLLSRLTMARGYLDAVSHANFPQLSPLRGAA